MLETASFERANLLKLYQSEVGDHLVFKPVNQIS